MTTNEAVAEAVRGQVSVINVNVTGLLEDWGMDGKTWCRHSGFQPAQWSRKRRGLLQWTLLDLERMSQGFGCSLIDLLTPGFGVSRRQ